MKLNKFEVFNGCSGLQGQGNAFTASNPSLAVAARAFGPSSLNRVSLEISYVVVNMYLYTNNNKIVITPTDAHKAVITVCVLSLSSLTMRAGWTGARRRPHYLRSHHHETCGGQPRAVPMSSGRRSASGRSTAIPAQFVLGPSSVGYRRAASTAVTILQAPAAN